MARLLSAFPVRARGQSRRGVSGLVPLHDSGQGGGHFPSRAHVVERARLSHPSAGHEGMSMPCPSRPPLSPMPMASGYTDGEEEEELPRRGRHIGGSESMFRVGFAKGRLGQSFDKSDRARLLFVFSACEAHSNSTWRHAPMLATGLCTRSYHIPTASRFSD